MRGRTHERFVSGGHILIEGNVLRLLVGAQVLISEAKVHRGLSIELVGEGLMFGHQLSVLASGLGETLIHGQRRKAPAGALLVNQLDQLPLARFLELSLGQTATQQQQRDQ
jgi:hypothetical protein